MEDHPQQAHQSSAMPASSGFVGKVTQHIMQHPQIYLAVIVILVVLVIWLYVYTYGLFGFGGNCGKKTMKSRRGKKSRSADSEEDGDPELEEMIDSINGAPAGVTRK